MSLPPNKNLLAEYSNRWFVETGSYRGDAIDLALSAGFSQVRSMDIDPENIKFCRNRFDLFRHPMPWIQLYLGDSAEDLWSMIQDICEPITFWLDSHSQLLEGESDLGCPFPLLKELQQIAMHPIKTHTIIIDDLLILTHPDVTGWEKVDIINAIKQINPAYQFKLVANPVKNNLLVCYVEP